MSHRPKPLKSAPEELQQLFGALQQIAGFLPNSALIMAKRPGLLKSFVALGSYINGPDLSIERGLRQMIGYMSSYGSGCAYCQAHTSHGAEQAGIDAEKVANLWQFETSELFDTRERAALSFAFAAGQTPNAVEDAHYRELAKHFSEEQILDIVAIIALFGFLNRWNDTLGTPLEAKPSGFARERLDASGWRVGKHGD